MNTRKEKGAFSVQEFLAWASIGRTQFYKEINEGRLIAHKVGSKTLITKRNADAWLASLPEAA